MYLMVETIQQEDPMDSADWKAARETFKTELGRGSICYMLNPVKIKLTFI